MQKDYTAIHTSARTLTHTARDRMLTIGKICKTDLPKYTRSVLPLLLCYCHVTGFAAAPAVSASLLWVSPCFRNEANNERQIWVNWAAVRPAAVAAATAVTDTGQKHCRDTK